MEAVSMELRSYGKIYNLGHAAIADLLLDDVLVEEKLDGSQFSFGVRGGELFCRSKGVALEVGAPDKMFERAVQTAVLLAPQLHDGWTYRGEYLRVPKHNTLAYDRIPDKHVALFDIDTGDQCYLGYEEKAREAARLGLEVVPLVYAGRIESAEQIFAMLDRTSVLGGQKIEGVVIKNYTRFGRDGKAMMGKHVSEAFKEVHKKDWGKRHASSADIKDQLVATYRSQARWQKAVQHLRERGELTGTPKDIGALMKEAQADIAEECRDEIKEQLYQWAIKDVKRGAVRGLPEWYKEQLVAAQFGADE